MLQVTHQAYVLILLQTEIEDMIWEVDEDCDQGLNWAEFQAMYHRCNNDKTGEKSCFVFAA